MPERRLKDYDSAERIDIARTVVLSGAGGIIGGIAGGWRFGIGGLVLGVIAGSALVYLVTRLAVRSSAAAISTFLTPSGKTTPHQREYSLPQSLALRGRYQEAIAAYELCCAESPADPEPYLRIARPAI